MTETPPARRARIIGSNLPTLYRTIDHIQRGAGVWRWDADGKCYPDCCQNAAHVG